MENNGVVKADQLQITRDTNGKGVTVAPKISTKDDKPQQFDSVTLQPLKNIKEVTVTPVDKNGNKVAEPTTQKIDSDKPTTVTLTTPVDANALHVEYTPVKEGEPTEAEILSVVACMKAEGKVYFARVSWRYKNKFDKNVL